RSKRDWSSDVCSSDLNDEVLAVAFQYTRNGRVYQVGEFSNDGVDNTGGELPNPNPRPGEPPIVNSSQNLVVKLLRSNYTSVEERSEERRVGKVCRSRW